MLQTQKFSHIIRYSKSCFHAYQKQIREHVPYIMIKSNEPRNFSPVSLL